MVHWFAVMLSMDLFPAGSEGTASTPGLFMANLGVVAAAGSLVRHITFGTMVGLLYDVYAS